MPYVVNYQSEGGYLPDSGSGPYDSIRDAAEYIIAEFDFTISAYTEAELPNVAIPTVEEIIAAGILIDPTTRDRSLQSYWSIDEISTKDAAEMDDGFFG